MPTCPGCQQHVSYDQLAYHERRCPGLQRTTSPDSESIQRLESRVEDVRSELDGRLRTLEARVGATTARGEDDTAERLREDDLAQRLLEKDL